MAVFTNYKKYLDRVENQTNLDNWGFDNNSIYRIFEFEDFNKAILFVNAVADFAEEIQHHPDIFIYDYKFVKVFLKSHEENKVTEKDYKSAHLIDNIYSTTF